MRYSLQLKDQRKRRGLTQSQFAEAMGVEQPTVQRWESGSRNPDVSQLLKMAEVLGVPPGVLFESGAVVPLGPRLFIRGEVAAGVWHDPTETHDELEFFTGRSDISAPDEKRFGLRVSGDSMDLLYPHGSIVECVTIDSGETLTTGRRVVVERVRYGHEVETTVKEYQVDRFGRAWLVPRSTNPAFQQPIQLDEDADDSITVRIIAIVVGSYRAE